MATIESWQARNEILSSLQNLKNHIQNFITTFEGLVELKNNILYDQEKKADLKQLFDQDPEVSTDDVAEGFGKAKAIYDWMIVKGIMSRENKIKEQA